MPNPSLLDFLVNELMAIGLPSLALIFGWALVLRFFRRFPLLLAFVSLGGTFIHEILHGAVGLLVRAKPISMSILPSRTDGGWVLGSVSFTNLHILNSAPVALAPLLMVPLGYWLLHAWMLPAYAAENILMWIVAGFTVASVLYSSIPSVTDCKIGAKSIIFYVFVVIFAYCAISSIWRSPGLF
ncbi:hypothetical protein LC612_28475 [Nostoc sp. CHAB 5834]|nr:hypothetical protein [Nostoc sp. CHAB 5834]